MGRRVWIAALGCAAIGLLIPLAGLAQTGVVRSAQSAPADVTAADQSGGTLDVSPRIAAPPPISASTPAAEPPIPADMTGVAPADLYGAPEPDAGNADATAGKLPYLGIAVQYIVSNDTPGREVHGLEVVGVDPASPAEQAGLHGRGQLTKLGASGATAGALFAPLDLVIMPLLKRAGDLGEDGDLIIAIDDNRVESESDLKNALAVLKPGDVIYLTLVRQHQGGAHETLKLPVRLAPPRLSARDGGKLFVPA
ncbi:MAG: PDZ domain-containing protein [Candidatus Binataceae bacterium]